MGSNLATIQIDRRDSFALVALRPKTINIAMLDELLNSFAELQNDALVRAVILIGTGEFFSAGWQVKELSPEQARSFALKGQALANLLESFGKPVIAAINGLATSGGCDLALACAWRIASPNATFAYPEVSFGLISAFGGTVRLPRIVGKARALELLLTGESISAEKAARIGLVNQVVASPEMLLPTCEELAQRISRNAPLAIKYAMETVNYGSEVSLTDGLRFESSLFGLCFATEDVQEGTKAFLEKRQPVFKGR